MNTDDETKRPARILVIDDQPNWRKTIERTLIQDPLEAFYVDTASNIEDARAKLQSEFYHVIILDIRLKNSDQSNADGMILLEEIHRMGLTEAVDIVMLSGHGTHQQMRDALTRFQATDYILKETFDNIIFLEQMRSLTHDPNNGRSRYRNKLSLTVHWQGGLRKMEVVVGLKVNDERITVNSPLYETLTVEMDDLVCRLFHNAEEVIFYPLTRGMSGAGVLRAVPRFNEGAGGHRVVKFGDVSQIHAEKHNFETYVQHLAPGGYATHIVATARTPRLGGITYSFLGDAGARLDDFGTFFKTTPIASLDLILLTLREIYDRTCSAWYSNPEVRAVNLSEHYRSFLNIDKATLVNAIANIPNIIVTQDEIRIKDLNEAVSFPNPVTLATEEEFIEYSAFCVTHGDLNERNILVDKEGHTWLIDFRHTGKGHLMRDFASLDTAIRFELLDDNQVTLQQRYEMEQLLNSVNRYQDYTTLSGAFANANPLLHKVFDSVLSLRQIAGEQVKGSPSATLREYQIALFYWTLNALRFKSLSDLQKQHVLLAAGLLAKQLL